MISGISPVRLAIGLLAALTPVFVDINARPWARIRVEGVDLGLTPLGSVLLEPGEHRFGAEFPDGAVLERIETIGAERGRVSFP